MIRITAVAQLTVCWFRSAYTYSRLTQREHVFLSSNSKEQHPEERLIPNRIVMNHRVNLLESPSDDFDRAMNVKQNLKLLSGITDVEFLDDMGCVAAIEETHSKELANYFKMEKVGMYKSDICRLAQLAKHGGYYFDTDLQMLDDMREVMPPHTSFTSVIALPWMGPRNPNELFQAFLGAAPGHPVIRRSMDMCLDYYTGRNETLNSILGDNLKGTALMRLAYEDWAGEVMQPGVREHDAEDGFKHSFLFEEERMNVSHPDVLRQRGSGNNCNIGVIDRASRKALAYSHSVGKSTSCHPIV